MRNWHLQLTRVAMLIGAVALAADATAQAHGGWEMRVCADPFNYPASSEERPGYDNRIAQLLADELNATLVFEWTSFDQDNIVETLHSGDCDLAIGMGESVAGVESTVPYLRAPYAFVSLEEDAIDVSNLDDPALAELRVGTYTTGVPSRALTSRGITAAREYAPTFGPGGLDHETPVLQGLVSGEVDVALVYGPAAAAFEAESGVDLRIVPIQPEVDVTPYILQMFRIFTVAVRPGDTDFREQLDFAIAARWEDIQRVLDEYGIPRQPVPAPRAAATADYTFAVGFVLPTPTQYYQPYERAGAAANFGVALAENLIATLPGLVGTDIRVLVASAPSDEAARRAAERLAATTPRLVAFAGGYGAAQARSLARVAEEHGVLFLNIAEPDLALRTEECLPAAFHIAASSAMYADAAVIWHSNLGRMPTVALVHKDDAGGAALAGHLAEGAARDESPGFLPLPVPAGQLVYTREIDAIEGAGSELVLVDLAADAASLFYAQARAAGLEAPIVLIPDVTMQTREYLYRLHTSVSGGVPPQPSLWEASRDDEVEGELNESYVSRTGEPMEASSWAAFAALAMVAEAVSEVGADAGEVARFLREGHELTIASGLGKGRSVSFRSGSQQLQQPIYFVAPREGAEWGRLASSRVDYAELLGTVPEAGTPDYPALLGRLGVRTAPGACAAVNDGG